MVSLHSTQIPHGSCHDIFKRQIEPKKIISALHFLTLKKSELFPFASGLLYWCPNQYIYGGRVLTFIQYRPLLFYPFHVSLSNTNLGPNGLVRNQD